MKMAKTTQPQEKDKNKRLITTNVNATKLGKVAAPTVKVNQTSKIGKHLTVKR